MDNQRRTRTFDIQNPNHNPITLQKQPLEESKLIARTCRWSCFLFEINPTQSSQFTQFDQDSKLVITTPTASFL